ncbi:MAG: hypothetical protein M1830_008917 [Pleopsidium flavum]|nr:MAG: hypothetical protein M1830_008917 [Pleopsidium flavum]
MSEVYKPVEDTPLPAPAAVDELNAPATEATADPIRPTGTDALIAIPAADTTTGQHTAGGAADVRQDELGNKQVTVTAQPISEGILGYKAPGLVKILRFSKKFFWFGHEPVEPQHLSTYLRSEKQEMAHPNAAYASQTGKGLLFFAKRIEDKAQPAGILNLSEASDVTKEGYNEFSFRLHGHKHTFQALTHAERDSWLVAVETKAAEAKTTREGIIGSDGYKHHMEKLGKPAALVAAPAAASSSLSTPKKSTDERVHDGVRNGDVVTSSNSSSDEATTKRKNKSRSQSRKRGSIFGTLLGKKEEHDDKKELKQEEKAEDKALTKELQKEEKAEERAEKEERKEEKQIEKEEKKEAKHGHNAGIETGPIDAAAIAARVVNEPVIPVDESIPARTGESVAPTTAGSGTTQPSVTTRENAPKPSKRNSLFGSLFNKVSTPSQEKSERDVGPTVPVKDTETNPVSAVAPQLADPVDTSAPKPVTSTGETAPVTTGTSTTRQPLTSSSPPKGGIFAFMKQKEAKHEDKKDIKADEKLERSGEEPVAVTGTPTAPGSGALPMTTAASGTLETPAQGTTSTATATTPEAVKDKRRTSFFGTLSGKKERVPDVGSEGEVIDGETKQKSTSSSKLGGLFRRPSRAVKGEKEVSKNQTTNPATVNESTEAPAPISKETPTTMTETPNNDETIAEPQANGIAPNQNMSVQAAA